MCTEGMKQLLWVFCDVRQWSNDLIDLSVANLRLGYWHPPCATCWNAQLRKLKDLEGFIFKLNHPKDCKMLQWINMGWCNLPSPFFWVPHSPSLNKRSLLSFSPISAQSFSLLYVFATLFIMHTLPHATTTTKWLMNEPIRDKRGGACLHRQMTAVHGNLEVSMQQGGRNGWRRLGMGPADWNIAFERGPERLWWHQAQSSSGRQKSRGRREGERVSN